MKYDPISNRLFMITKGICLVIGISTIIFGLFAISMIPSIRLLTIIVGVTMTTLMSRLKYNTKY